MEHYRTGPHSRFDLKYHFVWITKYRKGVLVGEVGNRLRELEPMRRGVVREAEVEAHVTLAIGLGLGSDKRAHPAKHARSKTAVSVLLQTRRNAGRQ